MKTNGGILATLAVALCSLPLYAQGYNNAPNQNNGGYDNRNYNGGNYGRFSIPAGTQINVRLDRYGNNGNNSGTRQGDLVQASLIEDLSVNGRVVAPSGSRVQLRVDSGSNDRPAYRLDSMNANGQFYRLDSDTVTGDRNGWNGNGYNGNDNRSGAQKLGDLITGDNRGNNGQNYNDSRRNGGQVLHFRLTNQARPQRNR